MSDIFLCIPNIVNIKSHTVKMRHLNIILFQSTIWWMDEYNKETRTGNCLILETIREGKRPFNLMLQHSMSPDDKLDHPTHVIEQSRLFIEFFLTWALKIKVEIFPPYPILEVSLSVLEYYFSSFRWTESWGLTSTQLPVLSNWSVDFRIKQTITLLNKERLLF